MFPTFVGQPVIDMSLEGLKKGTFVTPTEEFRLEIVKECKGMTLYNEPEETEKMHNCEHRRMKITGGFPSNFLSCCDCGWWQFFN